MHDWFKSDGDIVGFGGFCLVVEFHIRGSAANRATLYSSMRRCSWIVESVIDTNTCKLRLSSLTTVTSIVPGVQDNEFRRKSCFELITPVSSIMLSAIQIRNGGAVKTSFIDSGAGKHWLT